MPLSVQKLSGNCSLFMGQRGWERIMLLFPTDNIAVSVTGQFLVSYINWGVGEPRVHKLIIMGMSSRIEIEREGAVDSKR